MGRLVRINPINQQRLTDIELTGYEDYTGSAGAAAAGGQAPSVVTFGNYRVETWAIGDNKTFTYHIKHNYKLGTLVYPHVHWRTITTNPTITQTVQWDLTYCAAKSYSRGAYSSDTTISLLDTPTGYNYNEIIEATEQQAINLADVEIDGLIVINVKRVTPVTGTSYTGIVVLDFADIHVQIDGSATTTKNYPFTKVF